MRGWGVVLLLVPLTAAGEGPLERAVRLDEEVARARQAGASERELELAAEVTRLPWPAAGADLDALVTRSWSQLPEEARRSWARDRVLPLLAGELPGAEDLLDPVLAEVAAVAGPSDGALAELERARRLYGEGRFAEASAAYAAVARTSSLWPDALRERSWTLYRLARPDEALGGTVSLRAPYFPRTDHAEGRLLEATVLLERCRYAELRQVIAPLLAEPAYPADAVDVLQAIKAGKAPAGRIGRRAWNAPLVARARAVLEHSTAGGAVADRREAVESVAARLLGAALADEVEAERELRERALRLRYESLRSERLLRQKGWDPTQPRRPDPEPIEDDEVVWSFDGTWWRDELGSYRYAAGSACPKEERP